jgi:C-terminal processing protease CtpA/Prc
VGPIYSIGFVDGGSLSLPLRAFFNPDGSWDIENAGVSPDLFVEEDQTRLLRGEDVQLEAAVDLLLRLQAETPKVAPKLPPPMLYPPQPKLELQSSATSSGLQTAVTRRPKK